VRCEVRIEYLYTVLFFCQRPEHGRILGMCGRMVADLCNEAVVSFAATEGTLSVV